MNVSTLLPVPIVVPIIGAVAAPLLARVHRRAPLVVAIITMGLSTAVMAVIAAPVYAGSGHVISEYLSGEEPFGGKALGVALAADPFGLAFGLLTGALGLILMVSALSELGDLGPRELGVLACLAQLLLAALIGSALTADMINLFIWFEVAALASYGLTGYFLEQATAIEGAFKVLVLTSIAGFIVFTGAAVLYMATGALNFGQIHDEILGAADKPVGLAIGLLIAGFATKAGLVPFHTWLPDAHAQGPGAVNAMFSALMIDLGIIAVVRVTLQVAEPLQWPQLLPMITTLGVLSAVLGALMALAQDDLKRLLAWDTVSQAGVLVIGFASATAEGVTGGIYHLISHGIFKALLFLCAGSVLHSTGVGKLSLMGGLVRRSPLLTAGFTIGVLSICGVPPFNGYASLGLIHKGVEEQPVVFGFALLGQVLTVASLGRAAYLGFYRRRAEPYEHAVPMRTGMRLSLGTLGLGCAAFGVLPSPVIRHVAAPGASVLLHPSVYAEGVLRGHAAIPDLPVEFTYWDPVELTTSMAEVAAGVLVAVAVVRRGTPPVVEWIRRCHNGSVNDYAAVAAIGIAICCGVLMW